MTFRFIHSADIHLDSPLKSLALRDPALADLIGDATRRAFENIISTCLDERVDALLLAGDLYDGDQTSMKTARFLAAQLGRLHAAGIRTFIIRGNHDALSKITRELVLPETVTVFGGKAEVVTIEAGAGAPVAIHGISFTQPRAPESLLPRFRPPAAGAVNIGMLHTSLGGAAGHDPYAPCSTAELRGMGYRYWALGHVHRRSVEDGDGVTIVMPGNPQGRDINEDGTRSVTLTTIADDGSITVEEREVAVARFDRATVDADGIDDWRDLVAAVRATLARAREGVTTPHLVLRPEITGTTPLAWRIRRDLDLLKAEADNEAAALGDTLGGTWIEKLECGLPSSDALTGDAPRGDSGIDPVDELRRLIADTVGPSESFRVEARRMVEELRGQLPPECRDALGADEAAFDALLGNLLAEGADEVAARLRGGDVEEDAR